MTFDGMHTKVGVWWEWSDLLQQEGILFCYNGLELLDMVMMKSRLVLVDYVIIWKYVKDYVFSLFFCF